LQRELAALHATEDIEDYLLLLEHPPTITLGRGANRSNLLESLEKLTEFGISVYDVDRGGDVTYHGPGQLVGYPVFNLNRHKRDLHWFLRQMEQCLIQVLSKYSIEAKRFPPHTGVWVEDRKIAAMGIKVSRWVTTHGFALNVATEPADFVHIVPCGIRDYAVTSIHLETRPIRTVVEVACDTAKSFATTFQAPNDIDDSWAVPSLSEKSRKILSSAIDIGKSRC